MKTKYNPDIHHRRSIRLRGYDYSQDGLYFITICTQNRRCLFGEIERSEMRLNKMGIIAQNEWIKTIDIRNNVMLDAFVVMPNHIHGIIILRRGELHSHHKNAMGTMGDCDSPIRGPSNTIGAIVRGYKSAVTKQIRTINGNNIDVWQRNYHEHIIRDNESYQKIKNYINNNPTKVNVKS